MNVNFEYYKIFYYVAKYQNFTKAARALNNSQPNITRAMNCLEDTGRGAAVHACCGGDDTAVAGRGGTDRERRLRTRQHLDRCERDRPQYFSVRYFKKISYGISGGSDQDL